MFILAADSATLEAEDLASGETVVCACRDFSGHFGLCLTLTGITRVHQSSESAFDIKAPGRLSWRHVELPKGTPPCLRCKMSRLP